MTPQSLEAEMAYKEWLLIFMAIAMSASPVIAGGAALGQKVFNKCKACHDVAGPKNKVGPSLKGLSGRRAGSLEDFAYSEAMKSSGIA